MWFFTPGNHLSPHDSQMWTAVMCLSSHTGSKVCHVVSYQVFIIIIIFINYVMFDSKGISVMNSQSCEEVSHSPQFALHMRAVTSTWHDMLFSRRPRHSFAGSKGCCFPPGGVCVRVCVSRATPKHAWKNKMWRQGALWISEPPEDGGTATERLGGGRIKTEFQTCVICLIHKAVKTTLEKRGRKTTAQRELKRGLISN